MAIAPCPSSAIILIRHTKLISSSSACTLSAAGLLNGVEHESQQPDDMQHEHFYKLKCLFDRRCADLRPDQMLIVDLLALCFCTFFICMCLCLCVKVGQCYLDLNGRGTSKLGRHAVLLANKRYNQRYSQQT